MKSILSFIAGAVLVGISSGVIAQDIDAFNNENGYWCEVYTNVHSYCDPEVLTFNEENGYWN
jgi:hypothetical protein